MEENTRTVSYYIERINEQTGEAQLFAWNDYQGMFRTTNEMNSSDAFSDGQTANQIVGHLNQINNKAGGKHFYYRVDSDNQTRRIIPDDAPQSVKDFFVNKEKPGDVTDNTEQQTTE